MKPTLYACAGSVVGQGLKGSDRVRVSKVLNLLEFSPFLTIIIYFSTLYHPL